MAGCHGGGCPFCGGWRLPILDLLGEIACSHEMGRVLQAKLQEMHAIPAPTLRLQQGQVPLYGVVSLKDAKRRKSLLHQKTRCGTVPWASRIRIRLRLPLLFF